MLKKITKLSLILFAILCTAIPALANGGTLATYSTKFNGDNHPRVNNIRVAAQSINGTTIAPGETFSYNETVGPTTEARGYQKAEIFVAGQKKKGFGGGVCQVSSTIYNAATAAGLEITERHAHSKDVAYVPDNKDAATSYGVIDLKFKNTKNHPITIRSYVEGNEVVVEIVG